MHSQKHQFKKYSSNKSSYSHRLPALDFTGRVISLCHHPKKNASNLVQPFGMLALLYIQSEISDYLCLIETILIMEMETVYHMLESVPAMILSILTSHHRSK